MFYDDLFHRANDLYAAGALKQAEDLYRQILLVNPENADVLNMLGLIAQAQNKHRVATDYFSKVLNQLPHVWTVWFNLAVSLSALGQYDKALHAYKRVLSLKPDLKEAYCNLADVYEHIGEAENAVGAYRQALSLDPSYLEAAAGLALFTEDVKELERLGRCEPCSALPFYDLAVLALKKDDLQKAEDAVLKAMDIDENSAEINLLYAKVNLKLKNESAAKNALEKVLTLEPDNIEALGNAAVLKQDETLFKKALDLDPKNDSLHTAYADFLYRDGRAVEALEEYRKAVILNPDSVSVSNNLALVLKDRGEYAQALDLFFNAFTKQKDCLEISQNIAQTLVLLQSEDPKEALKIARRWVQTAPENQWAVHTLAAFEGRSLPDETDFNALLFDSFAPTYEATMNRIRYNVLDEVKSLAICFDGKILDLGCGTGLLGQTFKNNNNAFVGVDVSAKMLELAAQKNVYEKLIQNDIETYLKENTDLYAMAAALDVLNYFREPERLFSLLKGTPFLFTVEKAMKDEGQGCRLPNGRYRHSAAYIREQLQQNGYRQILEHDLTLREENGVPVEGTLFFARA
jgi:predicted TPR repeat methyltransferase